MSVWTYARKTIFNRHSRACCWKHPIQATCMAVGVGVNYGLGVIERFIASDRQVCPVCRWQGRRFRTFVSPNIVIPASICPVCGSFDRHRHLMLGMREILADRSRVPSMILGLSLSPAMSYLLAHEGLGRCFKSDYDHRDLRHEPEVIADLTRSGFATGAFDWVVCSHVLEHVPDLEPAVDELVRILRPGGLAWIQVAYQEDLQESCRIPLEPHDLDAHAWRFGADFEERLQRPGWEITCEHAATLDPVVRQRHGIHPVERYWVARKHG